MTYIQLKEIDPKLPRPARILRKLSLQFPSAWKEIDNFRTQHSNKSKPTWPSWCFCPRAGAYNFISKGKEITQYSGDDWDISELACLSAWRYTQGIYRFDQTILDQLWETPIEGKIPTEVLFHLPEWCVYIETPGREVESLKSSYGRELLGFFAYLDVDLKDKKPILYILLDSEEDSGDLVAVPIHLAGTIDEGLDAAEKEIIEEDVRVLENNPKVDPSKIPALIENSKYSHQLFAQRKNIAPLISLLLYLCTEAAEIQNVKGGTDQPHNPKPQRVKTGFKIFPASNLMRWEVAFRLGQKLRAAIEQEEKEQKEVGNKETGRARPRPHVRRGHYHHYWKGSHQEKKLILKWQPPILVNVDEDHPTIPVIRPVD